jgi:hypothetical protein
MVKSSVYLHIGTHKTGTSSIQNFLLNNQEYLRERGFLYPTAGRPKIFSDGHHNLFWALSNHKNYDPNVGAWEELISEIDSSQFQKIIVTSEELS